MRIVSISVYVLFVSLTTAYFAAAQENADGWKSVPQFSVLVQKDLELKDLLAGKIVCKLVSVPSSDLAIAVETCYVAPMTPEVFMKRLMDDQSATTVEASDSLDKEVHAAVAQPCTPENFQGLTLDISKKHVRSFLDKCAKTGKPKHGLNLSNDEAAAIAKVVAGVTPKELQSPAGVAAISAEWKNILFARMQAFQAGGMGAIKPFEGHEKRFLLKDESAKIFQSRSAVAARFNELFKIAQTGQGTEAVSQSHYWESAKVGGGIFGTDMTFSLASVLARPAEGGWQVMEITHYASSQYYTSIILYQCWPVDNAGSPQSVVWRGDYVLTPEFPFLKGMARFAAGNIMTLEIKKSIQATLKP